MKPSHLNAKRVAACTVALAVLATACLNQAASPQAARTIRIVVPAPPGGDNDIVARLLGEQVGRMQGATVVVENRPGARTALGTESVARAAPDGNTVLVVATPFLINPLLRQLNYDPMQDFAPICRLVSAPTLIVVNSAQPYRTLADLIDAARAKPGALTLASVGPGSPYHLGFELFRRAAEIDMTFVPFPGNAPAVNALLGEHVTAMFGTYADVAQLVKAGELRALAAATRTRIAQMPELPTVAESGFKDFEVTSWFGSYAPAKTPDQTLALLAQWFAAAIRAPEVRAKLEPHGLDAVAMCGTDFAGYLRQQYDDFGRIIRDADIKLQ